MHMRSSLIFSVLAGLVLLAPTAQAQVTLPYASDSYFQQSLGDQLGTQFDKLALIPVTSTMTLYSSVLGQFPLNDMLFTAGINTHNTAPYNTATYTATRTLNIAGITQTINQSYFLNISSADTLFMQSGPTVHYTIPNQGTVDVIPLGVTVGPVGPGNYSDQVLANVLWLPNHKMQLVTVGYMAKDNSTLSSQIQCSLSVSSNEAVNGTGDGNTSPDWQVVDAHHMYLRAERSGNGIGRVYTITSTCTDAYGNTSTKNITVTVPHDQGH